MRILHIGKYYPPYAGGMENFLGDLCPALERQGVTVGILVHGTPTTKIKQPEKVDTSYIQRVPSYGQLLYAPISPAFPLFFNKAIRTFRPDIIHFHLPNTSAFWGLILAKAKKIPWVIHWHSDVVPSKIDQRIAIAYKLYRPFEQAMLQRANAIIATSPNYLQSSETLINWQNKCHIVPLGINPHRINHPHLTPPVSWTNNSSFKIISVGRLTYYKGHENLIKALTQVDNAEAIIVGTGERHDKLQQLVDSNGISNKVKLAGYLPDQALYSLLSEADCFCLPSIERTEAFGLVLLEAMCYAKPVIVSDVAGSGMGWVVDNNKTGLLVTPNNPTGLAKSIKLLIENPTKAIEMGRAGFGKFQKHFHIDEVSAQMLQVYKQV